MTKDVIARRLQALEARRRVSSEAYNRICDEELAARLMEDPDSPAGGLAGNLTNRELALLLLNRTTPAPRRDGWNYGEPVSKKAEILARKGDEERGGGPTHGLPVFPP